MTLRFMEREAREMPETEIKKRDQRQKETGRSRVVLDRLHRETVRYPLGDVK